MPEVYDFLARDPANGRVYRVQVKTMHFREDRRSLVVYARKGNGEPYTKDEVDYIIGIDNDRAFMFECEGQKEYWSTEQTVSRRWIQLQVN
ncbi:hypothetical protein J2S08_000268 [Bacillus chungangensis]|uniref:PD(D/E)XK endonuclease domain-containing protein n=1 Tax=Bacillus chungangensis TaxID=587633 RepID=A0ABT9WNA1_9BACI|nr:hypothetical protein [Bacillus chungangensis]